jgi:hypothetical protein
MEKMESLRSSFSLYDVFGYIMPGVFFFVLFTIDFDRTLILQGLRDKQSMSSILSNHTLKIEIFSSFFITSDGGMALFKVVGFVIMAYVLGHIFAAFSSFITKHTLLRILDQPSDNLFKNYSEKYGKATLPWYKRLGSWIYRTLGNLLRMGYMRPFDEKFQLEFKKVAEDVFKYEVSKSDYYWLTYSYIHANYPHLTKRILRFVNLSGFARNIAGTIVFYLLFRIVMHIIIQDCVFFEECIIFTGLLFLAFILFWVYLRLYKRQAYDMFYIFYSLVIKEKYGNEKSIKS